MDTSWKEVAMDQEPEAVWLAFVRAEQAYRDAMAELRHIDMVGVLREGLLSLPWRRPALAALNASNVEISENLLPELFRLSCVSHALLGEVRRSIKRIPRETLDVRLEPLVRQLISDKESDYEAYRRTAELLRDLGSWSLLNMLTEAAAASSDEDIAEVADDFGELGNDHEK